jgi:hypothetical protein
MGRGQDGQSAHLLRIPRAYEAIATSMRVRGSKEKIDFSYENNEQTSYFAVNEGRIRTTSDSREIWENNFAMDDLSARRRNQT